MAVEERKRSASSNLRLTSVRVENWRNFVRADVALPRRTFLVGPNASGKSNFLDIFRFLRDICRVGGGFQEAVRLRDGVSPLRSLAARRYPDIVLKATIGNESQPEAWAYELRFRQDNHRRPEIVSEVVAEMGRELIRRPDKSDRGDPERLRQTVIEQVSANREFRDIADFFREINYLHIVPQLIREPGRSSKTPHDPFGGDFLEQVMTTPARTRKAWLHRIQEALVVAVPYLKEIDAYRDQKDGAAHLKGKYEHWRSQGAWQTEGQFSDGTLRLIGLLWSVLDGSGPLLLEEPELSLHPEVVRHIPQMFARVQRRTGRQIIASTHSADLLVDEGIGLDEVLLLIPETEGTAVRPAGDFEDIVALLDSGIPLPEVVMPKTKPRNASQLSIFGD